MWRLTHHADEGVCLCDVVRFGKFYNFQSIMNT